jgi:hypothetical protein
VLCVDLLQPFERKGWAGAVAQQPLHIGFDAHAGEGDAAAVFAATHDLNIRPVQQAAPDDQVGDASAQGCRQLSLALRVEARFLKVQALCIFSGKHVVDDYCVIVELGIESGRVV